ncbi:protein-L-isoaspartate O-methyltransferase family protein [Sinosporangium siamense]|uniref:protein-L-isoaspartate O-methyltransferase family protein n=1 Tax=Sinosporangium siamense TaxID=1367973 RepID=UPI001EF1A511|nr:methyltransferase domain-containing protein [Sinosporangium siamense]
MASDDPVITQVDDGELGKWGNVFPTSSSTALWLMERMFDALNLAPRMTVLEIGTGTGYNAAALAAMGSIVVSVEIDAGLAEAARRSLNRAGFADKVTVVVGDGELGAPGHAPFDRVIATAAAHTIPYPWVEQCKDGGRIVAPYTGEHNHGALMVLDVNKGRAVGRAVDEAHFMPLRGQRLNQVERQALSRVAPDLIVEITPGEQLITRA